MRREAACDGSTATLVNIIQLQNRVIEKQNAQQVLDKQLNDHLKVQLTNRDRPRERGGGALKHGYGALDAEALNALEMAAVEKKAQEEERQRQKQQEKEERQRRKDEAAAAKVARAEETAQRKLNWLAEKQQKADKRAAKAAEKAAQGAVAVGEVMEEVLGKGKDRFKVGGVVPKQECPGHF